MKTALLALGIGAAVEATLVGLLALGGIGPCGPASPVGTFVLFVHAPGLSLMRATGVGEPEGLILTAAAYVALWSGLAFLILGGLSRPDF